MGIHFEEFAVLRAVGAVDAESGDTLEALAVEGAIFVDGAAIVLAEEDASGISVREDEHDDGGEVVVDGDGLGEGREFAAFEILEEDGVVMAVLFAAGGGAGEAGALAEDGEADGGHGAVIPGVKEAGPGSRNRAG